MRVKSSILVERELLEVYWPGKLDCAEKWQARDVGEHSAVVSYVWGQIACLMRSRLVCRSVGFWVKLHACCANVRRFDRVLGTLNFFWHFQANIHMYVGILLEAEAYIFRGK